MSIPMAPGRMESLNVGVAGAILMFCLGPDGGVGQLMGKLERVVGPGK